MAYNVSSNFREQVYSGETLYDCRLIIGDTLIPIEQIETIKISSPIIDTTEATGSIFHIGTFISQSLEIKFRNLDGIDITNNPVVKLEIGLMVDDNYEYIPIGEYLIDELAEDYHTTCVINCLDYAVKFRPQLDISLLFKEDNKILASELFEAICLFYGVTAGTYPTVNNDVEIYSYDNTLSGKDYIMYLAELFGGNAKMGRNGECNIIPLKGEPVTTINALESKTFKVGNKYKVSRVCYDNGKQKFVSGEETNDTLYLRTDNIFITKQDEIDNIFDAIEGFEVYDIKCENRMDISLDCYDLVKYTTDTEEYYTLYDNYINFNGVAMGQVNVAMPTKLKSETTNIISNNMQSKILTLRTIINEQENSIKTIATQSDENAEKVSEVLQTVDGFTEEIKKIDETNEKVSRIEETVDGLTRELSDTGGNNIFYYSKEFWTDGTTDSEGRPNPAKLTEYTDTEIGQQLSVSGEGYLINNGLSEQKVKVQNNNYTISFMYEKVKPLATGYVVINNERYDLTSENWTEFKETVYIDTNTVDLQIYSDTDGAFKIFDLMGNIGTDKEIWTQNPNETRTDTVTIGKGIQVNSSTKNTYTRIDADGNRVYSTNTGSVIAEFTDKGMNADEIRSNVGEIGGILIQKIDGQTWFSSLL